MSAQMTHTYFWRRRRHGYHRRLLVTVCRRKNIRYWWILKDITRIIRMKDAIKSLCKINVWFVITGEGIIGFAIFFCNAPGRKNLSKARNTNTSQWQRELPVISKRRKDHPIHFNTFLNNSTEFSINFRSIIYSLPLL